MTATALALPKPRTKANNPHKPQPIEERALAAALTGLSPNSRRCYSTHLRAFIGHLSSSNPLSRESAERYLDDIPEASLANQCLSAIKRLAEQAASHGWLDWPTAVQIRTIRARRVLGTRTGNWLTLEQAAAMIAAPDARTLPGLRDQTVLALLLGCGIRRQELSALQVGQIQTRDDRTLLIDIKGKGNRLRSVSVPAWANAILNDWLHFSRTKSGPIISGFTSVGTLRPTPLSPSAIWDIVTDYAARIGVTCSPHDMRRTYAELAQKGEAPIQVIQQSLGHSSVATTERYLKSGKEANAGDFFTLGTKGKK